MSQEIEQIEISLEEAKKTVALKSKVEKLLSNREFKAVVEDGYFKDEALRLTRIYGDPQMADHRPEISMEIAAVSKFRSFLERLIAFGQMAEQTILEHEAELDELRQAEEAA